MGRFFVLPEQIKENTVEITGSDVNHIANVLRHSKGDNIMISSEGFLYDCTIDEILKDRIVAIINKRTKMDTELNVEVVLYQGLPKGDKMDLIIQKNVELGASLIVPVIMERTIVRIEGKDVRKRVDRWNRIALEAAKQCGRAKVPEVLPPVFFKEFLKHSKGKFKIMPYENENELHLKKFFGSIEKEEDLSFDVLIGPEGGISRQEAGEAEESGFIPVTLGKRILRTETASLYVTSCIAYEFEC